MMLIAYADLMSYLTQLTVSRCALLRMVDLRCAGSFCRVFEFINPELSRMSLAAIVGDIRNSMLEEVDFRKEATHIAEFAQYLDRSGASQSATCPFVYKAFSSKR